MGRGGGRNRDGNKFGDGQVEDICRQMSESEEYRQCFKADDEMSQQEIQWKRGLPNVFITIAPAEWKTLLHHGMFAHIDTTADLTENQATLTLHLYHALTTIFQKVILVGGGPAGFEKVFCYTIRIEFQGRGTLHIHVLAWVKFEKRFALQGHAPSLTGRTGGKASGGKIPEDPRLLKFLEKLFDASVDVQCDNGHHNFLNYVTSYETKASDA